MGEEKEMVVLRSCILHIETFSPVKRGEAEKTQEGSQGLSY